MNILKPILSIALALGLVAAGAYATEYHVSMNSPGASDDNPGTVEKPWKTFQPVMAKELKPGDKVLIHSGVYWETLALKNLQGSAKAPIVIEGVTDQGPVILKGSERFEGKWTRILDGTEKLVEPYPDAFRRRWVIACPGPRVNQVVLSDQRFLQQIGPNAYSLDKTVSYVRLPPVGETVEDMFRWTFFHDLENEKLYIDIVGEPSWYLIDVGRGGTVVHLAESRHVVVRNLDVRYGGNGIGMINSENVTVEDVTAFGNSETGFSARLSRHVTLLRGRTIHNGHAGVVLAATHDCDVIDTQIIGNNYRNFHTGWAGGGSKNVKTVRTSFVNCVSARNLGDGIWFDIDCQDTRLIGNRIHHNNGAGIHYEISFGKTVIANNLIYRNWAAGVYLSCSSGTLVAHNTLVENARGIAVGGPGRPFRVSTPPEIDVTDGGRIWKEWGGADGKYPMGRNRIFNNLFVRNGQTGDRSLKGRELMIQTHELAKDNVSDHNVFVGGWWPVHFGRGWNDAHDLEWWQKNTGWDRQSVVLDDLAYTIDADGAFSWSDPDAAARALRICPPIKDAGADMQGRQRSGKRVQAGAQVLGRSFWSFLGF